MRMLATLFFVSSLALTGETWDGIAARFDCTQKIQEGEQAGGSVYQIEYLPRGQKAGSHNRIFTITMMQTPQEEAAANEAAERALAGVKKSAEKAGANIHEFTRQQTNHGPVAWFDYTLNGERNMGVIARTGPGILAVYQIASMRGRAPEKTDRERMRALVGLQ